MVAKVLQQFLDSENAHYVLTRHSPAYTAQETAQAAHVHGMRLAKSVILKADEELTMVVIPAPYLLDMEGLQVSLGCRSLELAHESDFGDRFRDCETGALPPFGVLFDMPMYMADCFDPNQDIVFCAGSHSEIIRMPFVEFVQLAEPQPITVGFQRAHSGKRMLNKPLRFPNLH